MKFSCTKSCKVFDVRPLLSFAFVNDADVDHERAKLSDLCIAHGNDGDPRLDGHVLRVASVAPGFVPHHYSLLIHGEVVA